MGRGIRVRRQSAIIVDKWRAYIRDEPMVLDGCVIPEEKW